MSCVNWAREIHQKFRTPALPPLLPRCNWMIPPFPCPETKWELWTWAYVFIVIIILMLEVEQYFISTQMWCADMRRQDYELSYYLHCLTTTWLFRVMGIKMGITRKTRTMIQILNHPRYCPNLIFKNENTNEFISRKPKKRTPKNRSSIQK